MPSRFLTLNQDTVSVEVDKVDKVEVDDDVKKYLKAIFRPSKNDLLVQQKLFRFFIKNVSFEKLKTLTNRLILEDMYHSFSLENVNIPTEVNRFFAQMFGEFHSKNEIKNMNRNLLLNRLYFRKSNLETIRELTDNQLRQLLMEKQKDTWNDVSSFLKTNLKNLNKKGRKKKRSKSSKSYCSVKGRDMDIELYDPVYDDNTISECKKLWYDPKLKLSKIQRDEKYEKCLKSFGCLNKKLPLYLRPYTKEYFKMLEEKDELPCCAPNEKARIKGSIRLNRIKKELDVMSYKDAKRVMDNSFIGNEEKVIILNNIKESEENLNKFLSKKTNSALKFIQEYVDMMKRSITENFNSIQQTLTTGGNLSQDTVITEDSNTISKIGSWMSFFLKKGIDIVSWIIRNPAFTLFLTLMANQLRNQLCRWLSIKLGYYTYENVDWSFEGITNRIGNLTPDKQTFKTFFTASISSITNGPMFDSFFDSSSSFIQSVSFSAFSLIATPIGGLVGSKAIGSIMYMLKETTRQFAIVYTTKMVLQNTSENLLKLITSPCIENQKITKEEALEFNIEIPKEKENEKEEEGEEGYLSGWLGMITKETGNVAEKAKTVAEKAKTVDNYGDDYEDGNDDGEYFFSRWMDNKK